MEIPTVQVVWVDNEKTLIRMQLSLILSWAYTVHKYQGKTLDISKIDLGTIEKCSGMNLVYLSCVRKLIHVLLRPISLEQLQKVNRSNILPIIQYSYAELNLNIDSMKEVFSGL